MLAQCQTIYVPNKPLIQWWSTLVLHSCTREFFQVLMPRQSPKPTKPVSLGLGNEQQNLPDHAREANNQEVGND